MNKPLNKLASICIKFAILTIFILPNISVAQTNIGDLVTGTAKKIAQDKFNSETGLDKIKNLKDIDAGKIADKTVTYIQGDIPSPLLGNLITQISLGANSMTEGLFKMYLKKRPYSGKVIKSCDLAANQKMQNGLFNTRVKAHFSPWVDIAWTAVKSIADGGKSIGQLIAENTKSKVEKMIKETLFGKAKPVIETVTIPHHDSCDTTTKITWDPINMRIIVVTSGDCKCSLIQTAGGKTKLKDFTVTLVAPVTVKNVVVEEKSYFMFFKSYKIKAQYKVGRLKVATDANRNCNKDHSLKPTDSPTTPPKEEDKKKSILGRILDFIFGDDDKSNTTTDDKIISEEGEVEDSIKDDTDNSNKDNAGVTGGELSTNEETKPTNQDQVSKEDPRALQCGDKFSLDGTKTVQTFPYRKDASGEVNFSCNNSCASNQICTVYA